MKRQLEERSGSAQCLVRKLHVPLVIVREPTGALRSEASLRARVAYCFPKELGVTARTPVAGACRLSGFTVRFGQCVADMVTQLSSERFMKVDQIQQVPE